MKYIIQCVWDGYYHNIVVKASSSSEAVNKCQGIFGKRMWFEIKEIGRTFPLTTIILIPFIIGILGICSYLFHFINGIGTIFILAISTKLSLLCINIMKEERKKFEIPHSFIPGIYEFRCEYLKEIT